jgi:hypothetical protein
MFASDDILDIMLDGHFGKCDDPGGPSQVRKKQGACFSGRRRINALWWWRCRVNFSQSVGLLWFVPRDRHKSFRKSEISWEEAAPFPASATSAASWRIAGQQCW